MNNILFQDNLRTADKIEAARKAREKQISKGIFYGSTPSMESEIEKAAQSQPLDANGGNTDVLYIQRLKPTNNNWIAAM